MTEDEQLRIQAIAHIADSLSHGMYYASGAYTERKQLRTNETEDTPLTEEEKHQFYQEAGEIFDALTAFGFPGSAHTLLKTLEAYVSIDPLGILQRIGKIVRTSREYGYQYEQPASDLVVRLVQRYLVTYPAELRQNPESQRTLIEILDTFTVVGWPNALRLAYQLEQIYR